MDTGRARVAELYRSGMSINRIAEDETVDRMLLAEKKSRIARRKRVWRVVQQLARDGIIELRGGKTPRTSEKVPRTKPSSDTEPSQTLLPSSFEQLLRDYEALIDDRSGKRIAKPFYQTSDEERWLILSDMHVPNHLSQMDQFAEMIRRHQGEHCLIAGDLYDWEHLTRKWLVRNPGHGSMETILQYGDAILRLMRENFACVRMIEGNHDNRPANLAASVSPDLFWLTRQALHQLYEARHGIELVRNSVMLGDGRQEVCCSWAKLGDVIVSHLETSGKPWGRGVENAAKWLTMWRDVFGIGREVRAYLHAHTHKRSYHWDPVLHAHCWEIGATCGTQQYQILDHRWGPPQRGCFHLILRSGKIDVNASRSWCLDE